ncbi:hypothetical protein ABIB25_004629 [Nakamurella sp. UYEF19]|uniref:antibiotic biosynthesis monooxygenase n=1 Tax=Nakamurella sp. UYEF19 TaxID=1756392 RepID=UPI0033946B85
MFVLVAHFRIDPASHAGAPIPSDAVEPLEMLAASGRCSRLHFARSADVAGRFVLVAEFESAAAYRQSLSPWPMRTVFIPWLSTAEVEVSEVSEVLFSAVDGKVVVAEPTVTHPAR